MRYKHQLIDKRELLKEIDITYNSRYDINSVLWARNIICRAKVKENRKESIASILVEFNRGNIITKCSNCGQNINIMDNFCRNCGCQFTQATKYERHYL